MATTGMPGDPRLEPRRKLVCQVCGFWMFADALLYGIQGRHCGQKMVETCSDQWFLECDRILGQLWRALARYA